MATHIWRGNAKQIPWQKLVTFISACTSRAHRPSGKFTCGFTKWPSHEIMVRSYWRFDNASSKIQHSTKPKCDWKSIHPVGGCGFAHMFEQKSNWMTFAGDKSRHDQQCWADNLCENAADRTALQLAVTACESMVVMRFHTQVSVGKHTHQPWVQTQANRCSHYMTQSHTWASAGECIFNPWLRIQNMNTTMVGVRFRRYSAKAVSPSQRPSSVRATVRKSIPPSFQIFTFKHVLTLWVQRSNANATLLNVKHKLQETLSNQNKTRGVSPVRHGQLS